MAKKKTVKVGIGPLGGRTKSPQEIQDILYKKEVNAVTAWFKLHNFTEDFQYQITHRDGYNPAKKTMHRNWSVDNIAVTDPLVHNFFERMYT